MFQLKLCQCLQAAHLLVNVNVQSIKGLLAGGNADIGRRPPGPPPFYNVLVGGGAVHTVW
jgi:hypothetical protein